MQAVTDNDYKKKFIPYTFAAFLVGIVGGFTAMLGPAFVSDLKLPYNNTTWTALAMAVSSAAFAPIFGKLSDFFGRKKTLLFGIGTFTLGNILTATASTLVYMLIARFIVGIGSAAVAPAIMSFIVTEFPKEKIAGGFSIYMLISSIAVVFGPSAGSVIIRDYGWRKMMWLCVIISLAIFLLCLFTLDKKSTPKKTTVKFDVFGAVMTLIFFGLLLCIPSFGQNFGWSSLPFLICAVASVFTGFILIATQRSSKSPVLQLPLLKTKSFILSVIALFLTQGLMQANMTNIIVFINYTAPENAVISGYAISIMYMGMSLGAVLLGPLADRREPKNLLKFSFLLTGIGCAIMLLFRKDTPLLLLAASLGILGFGLGGNATVFMKIVFFGIPDESAGAGTGTYGLFRDLAAPFGVAVFVPLFTNRVTNLIALGYDTVSAAVDSIKLLGIAEIICVALAIAVVMFLPKIHNVKGDIL